MTKHGAQEREIDDMLYRRCTKCGEEKPSTSEYFQPQGEGLRRQCRKCRGQYQIDRYATDEEFKVRIKAHSRSWEKANPERVFELKHKPEYQAKAIQRTKEWYAVNPGMNAKHNRDKRASDPERYRQYLRAWVERHPDQAKALSRQTAATRRRRVNEQTVGRISYPVVLERDGLWCYLCQEIIISLDDLEFDHVIAIKLGGDHANYNLRPTHEKCNGRKWEHSLEKCEELFPGFSAKVVRDWIDKEKFHV